MAQAGWAGWAPSGRPSARLSTRPCGKRALIDSCTVPKRLGEDADPRVGLDAQPARPVPAPLRTCEPRRLPVAEEPAGGPRRRASPAASGGGRSPGLTMHCHAELRLSSPGQLKAARRRYKTFMIDEILSKETCDYFEKLSLYSMCPSLVVRPKPLHSCTGKTARGSAVGCGRFRAGVGRLTTSVLPPKGERKGPGNCGPLQED